MRGYTAGEDTLERARIHCRKGCTEGGGGRTEMEYALKSRMRWRGGYTGGEDALEGRMNWEERIHWNGEGCTGGGRMHWRERCTVGKDAL
jgi:hypothetical protein